MTLELNYIVHIKWWLFAIAQLAEEEERLHNLLSIQDLELKEDEAFEVSLVFKQL